METPVRGFCRGEGEARQHIRGNTQFVDRIISAQLPFSRKKFVRDVSDVPDLASSFKSEFLLRSAEVK